MGGFLSPVGQWYLMRALARLGVRIVDAQVREVRAGRSVADGELAARSACGRGDSGPRRWPASGLQVSGEGSILVDARLRSVSHAKVYAVGDAADADRCRRADPHGLQVCDADGGHVAENLARSQAGKAERPFRMAIPLCLSLGRRDGLLQLGHAGKPGGIITGRAARVKERSSVSPCGRCGWSGALPLPLARPAAATGAARGKRWRHKMEFV